MKLILRKAIKKVIVDGNKTDNKLTTFVNGILINALSDKRDNAVEYLSEADDTAIDEWLDMIVPKCISEETIIELMKAIDYYM